MVSLRLSLRLLFVYLLVASISVGAWAAGKKHPVAQLVEWELGANPAIQEEALRKMAQVILERAKLEDFPESVKNKIDVAKYRNNPEALEAVVKRTPLSTLKEIVAVPAPLQYFELPVDQLAQLTKHKFELPGEAAEQAKHIIYFQKNGQKYARWFIHPLANPDDVVARREFKSIFGEAPAVQQGDYKFHFTSSRSLIVFNENYDDAISLKLSLPKAEGPFKNKAIHLKEFSAWGRHNQYLESLAPGGTLPHMQLMQEPYGLGIGVTGESTEDAFLFRRIDELTKKNRYLLPAFAVFDEKVGRQIAEMNGSKNPADFWQKNLIEPLAQATAELRAYTGMEHTSPHSQNMMVELDENFRPTGKIVVRDFDFYIDRDLFAKLNKVVENSNGMIWTNGLQRHNYSLKHGMKEYPSWLSPSRYADWVEHYFEHFRANYSHITGIPEGVLGTKLVGIWGLTKDRADMMEKSADGHFAMKMAADEAEFASKHARWVKARGTMEKIPDALPWADKPAAAAGSATVAKEWKEPKRWIRDWENLVDFLRRGDHINGVEIDSEKILKEISADTLSRRRDRMNELRLRGVYHRIYEAKDADTIMHFLKVVDAIEPHFNIEAAKVANERLGELDPSPQARHWIEREYARTQEFEKDIKALREGDAGLDALRKLKTYYNRLVPTVMDALAFRLKRTSSRELAQAIVDRMQEIGAEDATVQKFLEGQRDRLSGLGVRLPLEPAASLSCPTDYAATATR